MNVLLPVIYVSNLRFSNIGVFVVAGVDLNCLQSKAPSSWITMSSENGSNSSSRDRNSDFSGDRVCRDFLRKVCRRGNRCKYVHPNEKEQDTGRELFTKLTTRAVVYLLFGYELPICLDCVNRRSADAFPVLSAYLHNCWSKTNVSTNRNISEVPKSLYCWFGLMSGVWTYIHRQRIILRGFWSNENFVKLLYILFHVSMCGRLEGWS
jgi:hypothetical protein